MGSTFGGFTWKLSEFVTLYLWIDIMFTYCAITWPFGQNQDKRLSLMLNFMPGFSGELRKQMHLNRFLSQFPLSPFSSVNCRSSINVSTGKQWSMVQRATEPCVRSFGQCKCHTMVASYISMSVPVCRAVWALRTGGLAGGSVSPGVYLSKLKWIVSPLSFICWCRFTTATERWLIHSLRQCIQLSLASVLCLLDILRLG